MKDIFFLLCSHVFFFKSSFGEADSFYFTFFLEKKYKYSDTLNFSLFFINLLDIICTLLIQVTFDCKLLCFNKNILNWY